MKIEWSRYNKAIAGAVSAAVVVFPGVMPDGITGTEWAWLVLAAVGGAFGVYVAPANTGSPETGV